MNTKLICSNSSSLAPNTSMSGVDRGKSPGFRRKAAARSAAVALCLSLLGGLSEPFANAQATQSGTIQANPADAEVTSTSGTLAVTGTSSSFNNVGGINNVQSCIVYPFQIPSYLLSGTGIFQQFTAANFSAKIGSAPSGITVNGDLYGLAYGTVPTVLSSDYYEGTLDSANTLIQAGLLTPSITSYSTVSSSNAALVNYLNTALNTARADGVSNAYVFLRLSPTGYEYWSAYYMGMYESGSVSGSSYIPSLSYTTTQTSWASVPLGGGGYVTGLASNTDGSAIYCRTDVGGAFRWYPSLDGTNGNWFSITDNMVPFGSTNAANLMNVESICTDPNNGNKVYVGAGNLIYGSTDQGNTWTLVTPTGWTMGGNGAYRFYGERMAVDPNNSNILWYGSSTSGLHKGVYSSGSWSWSVIPSGSVPFGTANIGVPFVVCDKNTGVAGQTIVYAGVSGTSGGGIYVSSDSGNTWALASGAAFTAPRRAQLSSSGNLYVTGGSTGVAELPRGGSLTLVTPTTSGTFYYNGIAVDPNDATGKTLYVADIASARLWSSTNAGSSWATQATYTATATEPDGTPSLVGYWFGNTSSMLVNPANSNQLMVGDFFGVASTWNAKALGGTGSTWYRIQKGQEETVVLATKSAPSGSVLLTGVSDVGGFYYNNIASRPYSTGGGAFGNPSSGNNTSLDFCESDPSNWVRAWVNGANHSVGTGAISRNDGAYWVQFGQMDARYVTNSGTAGWESFDVGPFLKQQKAAGATSVTFCVQASHWLSQSYLQFSSKEGANPPQLVLNGTTPLTPTDDSYVSMSGSTSNYGGSAVLIAQNYYNQPSYTRRSYLKFDLSGVSSITTGTLNLYRLVAPGGDTTSYPTTITATTTNTWTEGTITWNNMPTTFFGPSSSLYGGRVAMSSADPSILTWVPIGLGKAPNYSLDGGVTWTASTGNPGSQIADIYTNGTSLAPSGQCLTADRANGNFYYGQFAVSGSTHVIYSSTNSGASWTKLATISNGNSYNGRTPQIVAAPVSSTCPTGGDIWLCDDGTYNGNGGGLWRSINSGTSWSSIGGGVGKVTAVSFGQSNTGSGYSVYIYGYYNSAQGVYRSDDYGSHWVQLPSPTIEPVMSLSGDRQNYNSVFIGTNGRGTFHY